VAWIDNVRAVYTGNLTTGDFILERAEQAQQDLIEKTSEIVDDVLNSDPEESELEL
jgi:hypothetical protein